MTALLQSIEGEVRHGKQLGRTIGFPTANIATSASCIPTNGVYGVEVYLKNQLYNGVINIGNRPTFNDGNHQTVEVHILDFQESIYEEHMNVKIVFPIRPEKKFKSIEALIQQLQLDVQYARNQFKSKALRGVS